ncbi:MAG: Zn-dependent protease [Candidatus Paceibacteria bacterium]
MEPRPLPVIRPTSGAFAGSPGTPLYLTPQTDIFIAIQDINGWIVPVLSLGFLILSLGIHEASHAFAAWRCGDSTAKDMGRMTLDPIPHIDPIMTILVPAVMFMTTGMMFGGAKPVPVSYHRLRNPLRDMMIVALAGPVSNFLLAILFLAVWKVLVFQFDFGVKEIAVQVMAASVRWNLLLAAFNMIPVPPLDGSRVMTWLLPPSMREGYNSLERFGILLVFGLLWLPPVKSLLWGAMDAMLTFAEFLTFGQWS